MTNTHHTRFEVLTGMAMKRQGVFWVVLLCSPERPNTMACCLPASANSLLGPLFDPEGEWGCHVSLKCRVLFKLHGITTRRLYSSHLYCICKNYAWYQPTVSYSVVTRVRQFEPPQELRPLLGPLCASIMLGPFKDPSHYHYDLRPSSTDQLLYTSPIITLNHTDLLRLAPRWD
jgi:hypothetical protein